MSLQLIVSLATGELQIHLSLIAHKKSHFCIHRRGPQVLAAGQTIFVDDTAVTASNVSPKVDPVRHL